MTVDREARACDSTDGDSGLRCMKPAGHPGLHSAEIEWDEDDDDR